MLLITSLLMFALLTAANAVSLPSLSATLTPNNMKTRESGLDAQDIALIDACEGPGGRLLMKYLCFLRNYIIEHPLCVANV